MPTKLCTYCNTEKSLDSFTKCTNSKDGLQWHCSSCIKEKYEVNRTKVLARRQEIYQLNREKELEIRALYAKEHKAQKAEYDKEYRKANKDKSAKQKKEWEDRNRQNPNFKLVRNLRRRLHHALGGRHKVDRTLSLLGCTIPEFKLYLEEQFEEGMSWDNYGTTGWHIDHIRPCYSFDITDPEQQRECFHYTNQRPLWASENLSRSKSLNFRYPN